MPSRTFFPSSNPVMAYCRNEMAERIDGVCTKIRLHRGDQEILTLIQELAAHVVQLENELGQLYEGEFNAA